MNQDQPSPAPRKVKFIPKPRKPKPTVPKSEVNTTDNGEDEAAQAQRLMTKFNENLIRQVPKVEKKSSVQVAFGPGPSSPCITKYGVPKGENAGSSSRSEIKDPVDDDGEIISSSLSTVKEDGTVHSLSDGTDALPLKIKKQYREPWDYEHTYYPTTLPLRRPYSGDPEILNEAEFGNAAKKLEYNEKTINPASDLGLLEECDEKKMLFFQLPSKLPVFKRSATAKGKEKAEGATPSQGKSVSKKESSLEGLPGGYMGKMLIYRSGAVKLKLGDILFDVSPGSDYKFDEEVMAINTAAKHCCSIRKLGKRAVVTPDVDSLLNSEINLS